MEVLALAAPLAAIAACCAAPVAAAALWLARGARRRGADRPAEEESARVERAAAPQSGTLRPSADTPGQPARERP